KAIVRSPWRRTTARTASGSRTSVARRFWPKPARKTGLPPSWGVMSASAKPTWSEPSSAGKAGRGITTKAQRAQRKKQRKAFFFSPFVPFVPLWLNILFALPHVPDALTGDCLRVGGVGEHLDRHPAAVAALTQRPEDGPEVG